MDVLREVGMEGVIASSGREKYLVTELVECDLYRILEGDKKASKGYAGEYMREYSWAEARNAQLSKLKYQLFTTNMEIMIRTDFYMC